MTVADTSLTALRYSKQSGFGVVPTTGFQELRFASEDLQQNKEVVTSDEITGDRMPPDNIQVGSSAGGTIQSEVIGGQAPALDDFWLGALGQSSAFSTAATTSTMSSGTITVDNVTAGGNLDRITMVHSVTNWAAFPVGSYVLVSGYTTDAALGSLAYLNTSYQVVSVSTVTLTLTKGPRVSGAPKTTGNLATVGSVVVQRYGEALNGTALQYFTIERKYSIASSFARLQDEAIKGFEFSMQPKRPMRLTWTMLGKDELDASTQLQGSAPTAAPTNKSFAPVADMKSFAVGEDGHSFQLTAFNLKVDGGLYSQDEEAGTLGPQGTGLGTFKVTGRVEFYYEVGTLHSVYSAFQDKSLFYSLGNVAGDGLGFAIPRINFTNGNRGTSGKDQAVKGWLEFQAAKGTDPLVGAAHLIKILRR